MLTSIASIAPLLPLLPLLPSALAQYTATYSPGSLPDTSEEGQYGTNACGDGSAQDSKCQNVYVNGVDDFCLWGPPEAGSTIGDVEEIVVSYCLKSGYGTRLIPEGTLTGAHFVKVQSDKVSYVQVTGKGDLTKLLIADGDEGGELDPHSWTGLGNPQGGLVFTNAFSGSYEQTHEWTSFMSSDEFCIRACQDGDNAASYCQHIYDLLGCDFTIPGSTADGFDACLAPPTDEAPGVYDGSTFYQGDATTPAAHPAAETSECQYYSSVGGNGVWNKRSEGEEKVVSVTSTVTGKATTTTVFSTAPATASATATASTTPTALKANASSSSSSSSSGAGPRALVVGPMMMGCLGLLAVMSLLL
ncbi:hypothetical protein L202_06693 [Cryptococcus amylolentus CBS 6039]|uniref:Macrofage activating glycoprotein n=1 Tax=Cryptococcus amylolentus CBS 6039 TaxID=1295533 RepID=A0A1E3HHG2_9TREE|nr:hypothetical protein L202_06693 [Cryptococcus amylolentus CBS 6039]ODN75565.1 hypothetical protein L202_06693 [Cryptococcus amylolentus CBS 6039]